MNTTLNVSCGTYGMCVMVLKVYLRERWASRHNGGGMVCRALIRDAITALREVERS